MVYVLCFALGFLAAFALLRPLYHHDRAWNVIRDVWLRSSTPDEERETKAW